MNDDLPIGTIIAYAGILEPTGWIFCDGIPRDNGQIYKELISMDIGILDSSMNYVPPAYTNAILTKIDDTYNDVLNQLIINNYKTHSNNVCHTYIANKNFESYNNNFFIKNEDNCQIKFVNKKINWIIKYNMI